MGIMHKEADSRPKTYEEVLPLLPKKDYYFASEIAVAFEVSTRTVQYASKRHGVGKPFVRPYKADSKKKPKKHNLPTIYTKADILTLTTILQGYGGAKKKPKVAKEDRKNPNDPNLITVTEAPNQVRESQDNHSNFGTY